jgi:large subunit ribosomal protein L10e
MARLRKFVAYRRIDKKPYTRFSKYKKYSFIKAKPVCRIARFNSGDPKKEFDLVFHLDAGANLQIRDNAIESSRIACNRTMEKVLGKTGFYLNTRIYPHHILRENPLAAGAGADRLSTGMAHSFGKPIGTAVRLKKGQHIFSLRTDKANLILAKKALKKASHKLPCKCSISIEKFVKKQ